VGYLCANFSLPIGLSVLDLGPMYATDRQTSDVRRASSLNVPSPRGGGIITWIEQGCGIWGLETDNPTDISASPENLSVLALIHGYCTVL